MAKGHFISVGASILDAAPYGLTAPLTLASAETDANAVAAQAAEQGITVRANLVGADATTTKFYAALDAAAAEATPDDLVILYFSGHGGIVRAWQLRDDPTTDKLGLFNAVLCFFDRPLLDDEMLTIYPRFRAGTRQLILLDACYAGGMSDGLESPPLSSQFDPVTGNEVAPPRPMSRPRSALPSAIERAFLDWSQRGRESVEVSLQYAKRFDRLVPFHVAEVAVIANLPAYRRALTHRRWPRTLAEFNSDDFVSPTTRDRIQQLPKAQRDAVLTAAFADGLVTAESTGEAVRAWRLEGPHRDVTIEVRGALRPSIRGFRNAHTVAALERTRPPVGPSVQMLCATTDGLTTANTFTPQLLALQEEYAFSHVQFARDLDAAMHTVGAPPGQVVMRAYSAPEPVAFTLQHPWQVT